MEPLHGRAPCRCLPLCDRPEFAYERTWDYQRRPALAAGGHRRRGVEDGRSAEDHRCQRGRRLVRYEHSSYRTHTLASDPATAGLECRCPAGLRPVSERARAARCMAPRQQRPAKVFATQEQSRLGPVAGHQWRPIVGTRRSWMMRTSAPLCSPSTLAAAAVEALAEARHTTAAEVAGVARGVVTHGSATIPEYARHSTSTGS